MQLCIEFFALAPKPGADRLADLKFASVKSILAFANFGGFGSSGGPISNPFFKVSEPG